MSRQEKIEGIGRLCKHAGCNEKMRALHFAQFVERGWHPHPPQRFLAWWARHDEFGDILPVVAFNAAHYFDQYVKMKDAGAA